MTKPSNYIFLFTAGIFALFPFDQAIKLSTYFSQVPLRFTQPIALGLAVFFLFKHLKNHGLGHINLMFWVFALYVGYNLVSISYTTAPEAGMRQFVVLLSQGIFFYGCYAAAFAQGQFLKLVRVFTVVAVLVLIFSIVQFIAFKFFLITLGILPETAGVHLRARAYGFYIEPNWFGVYQICVFPFLFFAQRHAHALNLSDSFLQLGLGAFAISLVLAGNRGILLGFLALLPFYFFFFDRISLTISLLLKILFTVAIGALIILTPPDQVAILLLQFGLNVDWIDLDLLRRLMEDLLNFDESAARGRIVMYNAMFESFLAHPVLGSGIASWTTIVVGLRVVNDHNIPPNLTAPNELLRVLAEDGLIGFTLIASLALYWLYLLVKCYQLPASRIRKQLAGACILSFLGFILVSNFYGVRGMLNAFPLLAFCVAYANYSLRHSDQ